MVRFGSRFWLLTGLIGLSGAVAAAENRSFVDGAPAAIERPGDTIIRPLERMVSFLQRRGRGDASSPAGAHSGAVSSDNLQLQHLEQENARLRLLLKMKQQRANWMAADVLEHHPSHWFQLIGVDAGSEAGVKKGSVAVSTQGLVGHVVYSRRDSSDVQLVTDQSAVTGAIVERTHDAGYVQGAGREQLTLTLFAKDHGMKVGDRIVTSPLSASYPQGLLIGVVSEVRQEGTSGMKYAMVQPAVDLNALEQVLVIP